MVHRHRFVVDCAFDGDAVEFHPLGGSWEHLGDGQRFSCLVVSIDSSKWLGTAGQWLDHFIETAVSTHGVQEAFPL